MWLKEFWRVISHFNKKEMLSAEHHTGSTWSLVDYQDHNSDAEQFIFHFRVHPTNFQSYLFISFKFDVSLQKNNQLIHKDSKILQKLRDIEKDC